MEIRIDRLDASPFTYDDLIPLLHLSFEEHFDKGLQFTCSSMTKEQFMDKTKDGVVLVAWDPASDALLGTMTVEVKKDKQGLVYGYLEYLAISPSAKRLGIGSRLVQKCYDIIDEAKGSYVLSDTAVGAKSSVRWHLKNGLKIIGLESYRTTNYYSYLFRRQIATPSKWNNDLYVRCHYYLSYLKCKLLKKEDGSKTAVGNLLAKVL